MSDHPASKTKVYIKTDSWLAFLAARKLRAGAVAIVFGNTIHLYKTRPGDFLANRSWVLHELKHVEQYQRYGLLKFLYHYLRESFNKGYFNNALEIEARNAENDGSLLDKFEIMQP
ncbi:MAG TPA: DUF4157 domain-containing protein [Flavipsychrobacter sp.]|nr:DUF4157 domain-containing protein [Flavipsychrobacter sp.]